MTTLRAALAQGARALSEIDGGTRDARLLLAAALGLPVGRLSLEPDRVVSEGEMLRFQEFLDRRSRHEPVARILARRVFWGREFIVSPATLDPRPETETLIAAALEVGPLPRLLDLGTGTGILAVTLLAEWPEARGVASDLDPACLEAATENAARHDVAERLTLTRSDWFAEITGPFRLIVSNPPYIAAQEMAGLSPEVANHDPHLALTDGADGLTAYRRIAAGAAAHLTPGGTLMVEIGPTQGPQVARLFTEAGLENPEIRPDLDGRDRVVIARNPGR
jgi:release factor glutamine methyltransferase